MQSDALVTKCLLWPLDTGTNSDGLR